MRCERTKCLRVHLEKIAKTTKREIWGKTPAGRLFRGASLEMARKHSSHPAAPGFLDRLKNPYIIIDQHVMVRGIASTNVAQFLFFMHINQDTIPHSFRQA